MSSEVRQDDFSLLSDEHAAIVYKNRPGEDFSPGRFSGARPEDNRIFMPGMDVHRLLTGDQIPMFWLGAKRMSRLSF